MPARPTPLQNLYLDLNLARSRYTQVLTTVEALRIADGEVAPLAFYSLLSDDPESLLTEARLHRFAREVMG